MCRGTFNQNVLNFGPNLRIMFIYTIVFSPKVLINCIPSAIHKALKISIRCIMLSRQSLVIMDVESVVND